MAEPREVTITTQAHRRELRVGELSAGDRLPFHPSTESLAAWGILLVVCGLIWLATKPLHIRILAPLLLLVVPLVGGKLVGMAQGVGRSPTTGAAALMQFMADEVVYRFRRLDRPEKYRSKTASVPLPELEDEEEDDES